MKSTNRMPVYISLRQLIAYFSALMSYVGNIPSGSRDLKDLKCCLNLLGSLHRISLIVYKKIINNFYLINYINCIVNIKYVQSTLYISAIIILNTVINSLHNSNIADQIGYPASYMIYYFFLSKNWNLEYLILNKQNLHCNTNQNTVLRTYIIRKKNTHHLFELF